MILPKAPAFDILKGTHRRCFIVYDSMIFMTGWWLTYPSEKYEFVSWDYELPNIWKFMFQTTNQMKSICFILCSCISMHIMHTPAILSATFTAPGGQGSIGPSVLFAGPAEFASAARRPRRARCAPPAGVVTVVVKRA